MPRVTLIGGTFFYATKVSDVFDAYGNTAESLIEFAGRNCYQSFGRPNSLTAKLRDYLRNILKQKHYSVLEHGQATFYITGVSRSFTHELIRHRHLSYSELSQRFVDVEHADMITPPALVDNNGRSLDADELLYDTAREARAGYWEIFTKLTEWGLGRKQAREAARAVIPNMVETKIVVTGNFRAWRDVLAVRGTIHADREIRAWAVEVGTQLKDHAPGVFQDLTVFVDEDGHESIKFEELT